MAYVPPHKRHSKTGDATSSHPSPAPPPGSVVTPQSFQRKQQSDIIFAQDSVSKWFIVGLVSDNFDHDSNKLSNFTRLEPTESVGRKSLALTLKEENGDGAKVFSANPWIFAAETVKQDFVLSLEKVNDLVKRHDVGEIKSYLAVRFGNVRFSGRLPFGSSEYTEGTLKRVNRFFYTNVPASFMEQINDVIAPEIGLKLVHAKDIYQLKISDNMQLGSTISCKCSVVKGTNFLQLLKIEVNPVRHLVADMSCLDKNLDLRVILLTKNKSFPATDEILENIKGLISCAKVDPETKGGLRWPLGKQSLGRYTVVAVWHSNSTTFKNSSTKLKVRVADRYDFRNFDGEVSRETSLYMPKIVSQLGEEELDTELAFEMLKEKLELIWKHFLL